MLPYEIGGSCKAEVGDAERVPRDVVLGVVEADADEHASSSTCGRSCGPVFPAFERTRLNTGLVGRSVWVASLKRSARRACIISRMSSFVALPGARASTSNRSS